MQIGPIKNSVVPMRMEGGDGTEHGTRRVEQSEGKEEEKKRTPGVMRMDGSRPVVGSALVAMCSHCSARRVQYSGRRGRRLEPSSLRCADPALERARRWRAMAVSE